MAITRIERGGWWLAILIGGHCWAPMAGAQTWRVEPSITATTTATNNSGFGSATDLGGDVLLEVTPRVAATGRGAMYTVNGTLQADSISYARNTIPNQFIPRASLSANATAIDRWLYLDAGAELEQFTGNPFSAATSGSLPEQRRRARQYRLSPYIDHAFTPSISLLYRNENAWSRVTRTDAATAQRSESELHGHSLVFTQRPLPFGYALEAKQETVDFVGSESSRVELESARAVLSYAVDPTLILGAVMGAERNTIASSTSRETIRGLRVRWRPSERTDLDASAERRFFNNGWNLAWSHRSPFVATNLDLSRQIASRPTSIVLSNTGGDLRRLLDAAYTTRFPNPVERAAVVDTALATFGASAGTTGPIAVFSDYAQLERRAALAVAFLSPLSVMTVRLFASEAIQLQRPDAPALPLPPINADNSQIGGSLALARRLTTTFTLDASLSGVKIEGRGTTLGQSTTTKAASLSGNQQVTPTTRLVGGARRQLSSSNVVLSARETAAFIGIEHRF
jgi:uncharacterized protein (PEP-CTERM system associated)